MRNLKLTGGIVLVLTIALIGCNNRNQQSKTESKMKQKETEVAMPAASKFVSSPLRNRIKLELNAPLADVWSLVGDPGRMPEYSAGLDKVDTEKDAAENCTAYVCHFRPMEEGGQGILHRAEVVWFEPNTGWASLDEEPNAFGLQQSLTLITFVKQGNRTIVNWDMHFTSENSESIQMNVSALEQALNDIAQNLIKKFGGKIVENFAEGKQN